MAAGAGLVAVAGCTPSLLVPPSDHRRHPIRPPGSRPDPPKPEGTDMLPEGRAHRHLHAGEPLLRQLPRGARPRRRVDASVTTASPRTPTPTLNGNPVPMFHIDEHLRHSSTGASQSWNDEPHLSGTTARWTASSAAHSGPARWATDDGRHALLLRPRAHVPGVRPVVLLGPRPRPIPNRRFLQAATVARHHLAPTSTRSRHADRAQRHDLGPLNAHGITWHDYYIDLADIFLFPTFCPSEQRQDQEVRRLLR